MSGNACEVKANKQELLPPNTTIRQTDDGTLFYWKFSPSPQRLHVIWKGKEVDAKMPGKVYNTMIHGSAFYFESNDKIYKSVFSSSDGLKVVYLREKIQDEQVLEYGLYTRFKRGHHYLYRACDDPEFGGIQINVGEKLIKDLSVRCIHRRNVICARQHNTNCQKITVQKIGKSIIEIKFAHNLSIHSLDSSPFIYISNFNKIHTLDTESMQFLPPLLITSLHDFEYQRSFHNLKSHFFNPLTSVRKIAGVHDGEITVHAQIGSNDYWVTAELPEEYYDTDEKRTEKIELYIREHLRRYENGNAFPSRFAAEFTIQQLLGTGEFGAVFQAVSDDDLACAVKRVSFKAIAELDDIVRALREVQAMSQFNHIGIVRFYNAWIEIPSDEHRINMDNEIQYHFGAKSVPPHRDSPIFIFIQMELCNGTLKEWLKASRDNPRNITRMKSWFKQIVAAVDYIHEKGFIHRDLKPSNIIFAGEDHLKICDLGIATAFNKENGEEITASYTNVGTPLYKAPEQAYRYNSKVDVFALGLILAEMLTVMTDEERRKLFHRIRHGLPNPRPDPKDVKIFGRVVKSFKNDRNENSDMKFIKWMAHADSAMRPKCSEILQHPFLAHSSLSPLSPLSLLPPPFLHLSPSRVVAMARSPLLFRFVLSALLLLVTAHGHSHEHHDDEKADKHKEHHEEDKSKYVKGQSTMPIAEDLGVSQVCKACVDDCKKAVSWDDCYYCILDKMEDGTCKKFNKKSH